LSEPQIKFVDFETFQDSRFGFGPRLLGIVAACDRYSYTSLPAGQNLLDLSSLDDHNTGNPR
jgi:hypothetical protein